MYIPNKNDNNPSITYSGGWKNANNDNDNFGHSHHFTQDTSAVAELEFIGIVIYLLSPRWPYNVGVQLSLDSSTPVAIDMKDPNRTGSVGGPETVNSSVLWSSGLLQHDTHNLKISFLSGMEYAAIDAFILTVPEDATTSSAIATSTPPLGSAETSPSIRVVSTFILSSATRSPDETSNTSRSNISTSAINPTSGSKPSLNMVTSTITMASSDPTSPSSDPFQESTKFDGKKKFKLPKFKLWNWSTDENSQTPRAARGTISPFILLIAQDSEQFATKSHVSDDMVVEISSETLGDTLSSEATPGPSAEDAPTSVNATIPHSRRHRILSPTQIYERIRASHKKGEFDKAERDRGLGGSSGCQTFDSSLGIVTPSSFQWGGGTRYNDGTSGQLNVVQHLDSGLRVAPIAKFRNGGGQHSDVTKETDMEGNGMPDEVNLQVEGIIELPPKYAV
ncbi:hypothetical protein VKT23_016098 [Stygiomarasmius scandens]|uniref:Uncharacterized protein n=1 Tax=Marasmiellus scandens TaxID=2682957 RepID=A0ABR1J092_9AGAR